ncbi:13118_t:CDS:2, partial [Dentiscutata heterogama]
ANIIVSEEGYNDVDILETLKGITRSVAILFSTPPILSFIHPWLQEQFVTIPYMFKPVIEKRLYDKKRLGDSWVAPLDLLQYYLDDPEITPDLDPNNVNYDYIADAISFFIFAAIETTSQGATSALYGRVVISNLSDINNDEELQGKNPRVLCIPSSGT